MKRYSVSAKFVHIDFKATIEYRMFCFNNSTRRGLDGN